MIRSGYPWLKGKAERRRRTVFVKKFFSRQAQLLFIGYFKTSFCIILKSLIFFRFCYLVDRPNSNRVIKFIFILYYVEYCAF